MAEIPRGMRVGDLLLVAISRRGFDFLAQENAVLPADLHIPPGPTATNAEVAMDADILGYARYGRVFAGIKIDELVLFEDPIGIRQLYGHPWSLRELLFGAVERGPAAAMAWRTSLEGYFGEIR